RTCPAATTSSTATARRASSGTTPVALYHDLVFNLFLSDLDQELGSAAANSVLVRYAASQDRSRLRDSLASIPGVVASATRAPCTGPPTRSTASSTPSSASCADHVLRGAPDAFNPDVTRLVADLRGELGERDFEIAYGAGRSLGSCGRARPRGRS